MTVPERPGQSRNSLSCPLSCTEGALSQKRPGLVPRFVSGSLGTEISERPSAATLTNARVEDCTCTPAAKKPRRECLSWREEFPGIQQSVVQLCGARFDLLHFSRCLT